MSNSSSFAPPPSDDHNRDTSAANTATSGGSLASVRYQTVLHLLENTPKFSDKWFRLKEEEIHLRSQSNMESGSADLVMDSSELGEVGEVDDLHVGAQNVEKISASESDRLGIEEGTVPRGQLSDHSSNSQLAGIICTDGPKEYALGVMTNDSVSHNPNKNKEEVDIKGHLDSPRSNLLFNHDIADKLPPPNLHSGLNSTIGTLGIVDDETPPVPLMLHSQTQQDEQNSKRNAGFETLQNTHDMGLPLPLPYSIHSADAVITKVSSQVDVESGIKSKQPPIDQSLAASAVELGCLRQDKAILKQSVAQESRRQTEVNTNNVLHDTTLTNQDASYHSRTISNVLAQSVPSEVVHEGEEKENVLLIPEAFLVEANAPVEAAHIEVAELIEPDRSMVSLKKRNAFIVSLIMAAAVIAMGIGFYFKSGHQPSSDIAEATSTFLPSSSPIFVMPSFQPSLSRRYEIEKTFRRENITFDGMDTVDDRILALEWIIDKDPMKLNASASNLVQHYILALLAYAFSNLGWISGDNECEWFGVECDKYGIIIELNLSDSCLDGTIPPKIDRLQYLRMLSLSNNSLSGTIPSELGNLKALLTLHLNENNFTGTLASDVGNLKQLTKLDLTQNDLTGSLPPEIVFLTSLTYLDVSHNGFSGTLPSQIVGLVGLQDLYLEYNSFSGILPSRIGDLKELENLWLSHNHFNGTLPSELGKLTSLTRLDMSLNDFTGTFPSQLGDLISLKKLFLDFNSFTGTLPSGICYLNQLEMLWIHDNLLNGTLPSELGKLTSLTNLAMGNNQFTGTLPSLIVGLVGLQHLYLNHNSFTGMLPSWIGDLNELETLWINNNHFNGTLHSELGNLTSLISLCISDNEFMGTFPSWIGGFQNLSILWISNNQFTGTFPSEIENNLELVEFCLRNNEFTGGIPKEIENEWTCP